jgi:hypothetical protein
VLDDYQRNVVLCDLTAQPDDIKNIIKETIETATKSEKNIPQVGVRLLKLCSEYDLNKISDFQLEKGLKIAGDDFLAYCQTDGLNVDRNKAAEILPTLPKPEAHRFEAAIKKAGYNPETAYTLMDRLFDKESQGPAGPPMPGPAPEPNPYAVQQGENDANYGNRLQGMQQAADAARAQADSLNEDADQADLDIEAAQAQAEADQHRRARIVNPQLPMQPELKQQ